jgi:hypothetical protein
MNLREFFLEQLGIKLWKKQILNFLNNLDKTQANNITSIKKKTMNETSRDMTFRNVSKNTSTFLKYLN